MNKDLRCFFIPKAKGYRKITTYTSKDSELYRFHKLENKLLDERIKHSDFAKAYIKNRSIIANAESHMYNDVFISLDIKDFFQSINHHELVEKLYYEVNKNKDADISKDHCEALVKSCSTSARGIAVGLSPSPQLSNIYLKEFDGILYGRLKGLNLNNIIYTRYADDMVISYRKSEDDSAVNGDIIEIVSSLLRKYGLELNTHKTQVIDFIRSNHVRITGINITRDEHDYRKLTVGRKLKNALYYRTISLCKNDVRDSEWYLEARRIKGLQSFILSVEGEDYESAYSDKMISVLSQFGHSSLKQLIDNLA